MIPPAERHAVAPGVPVVFFSAYFGRGVSGAFRQERLVRKLLAQGHPVTVVRARSVASADVLTFSDLAQCEAWLESTRHSTPPATTVSVGVLAPLLRRVKHALLMDLVGSGLPGMYRAGRALSRAAGSQSLACVASSPPFACALAAFLVAGARSDRRLVVDMRDAWAEHSRIYFWRGLRRWVESRVLGRAEMVSTVSRYLAEEFATRRGAAVDVLYNCDTQTQVHAIATAPATVPRAATDVVSIVYVGSLPDGFYDLGAFVEGVAALGREAPDALRRLHFTFIGTGDALHRLVAQRSELAGVFSFEPPVPHAKAVEAMRAADAVLFFGFDAPRNAGVVSTKIFEYFELGVPIVALGVREESDLEWLFVQLCGEAPRVRTPEEIARELRRAVHASASLPRVRAREKLADLEAEYGRVLARLSAPAAPTASRAPQSAGSVS
ncbi:MAG: hypothetical protein IT357_16490 [Gemmatimonadaceae bacterium]|nr:hypothetical protein [Gemmatimonadaceae bacterium]